MMLRPIAVVRFLLRSHRLDLLKSDRRQGMNAAVFRAAFDVAPRRCGLQFDTSDPLA
jgi:hypothetical protein